MKYMLFAGNTYYPEGGFSDFKGLFGTVDLAIEAVSEYNENKDRFDDEWDWWHVVNALSLEVVDCSPNYCYADYEE